MKINPIIVALLLIVVLAGCHHQPKPESKDYTKVKVTDSGHRDSVIDNKQRLYNASLPDPCLKCVVAAVRNTEALKKYVSSADSSKLVYLVDWASGPKLDDSVKRAGSGLLIHVLDKSKVKKLLAAFTFDNVKDQLFLLDGEKKQQIALDSATRLKIRNACFWGVASGK